ncbi:Putative glucan endo-1,3-beta-glucosidase btgC [Cladobotryum mycophilum]|uniref:glucan endo-1,3-beta-D-glucosidase n=1 Tax=Cladobotryum mycophilum TaxID=491253 RepID=A0ABR0T468_9HYPO
MPHYAGDVSHEREPLDAVHRSASPNQVYSEQYHDATPRHPAAPSTLSFDPAQDGYSTYDESEGPAPPPHHDSKGHAQGQSDRGVNDTAYVQQRRVHNTVTPGADNFSESAAGGVAGIAYGVAERNARDSGIEAMSTSGLPLRLPMPIYPIGGLNPLGLPAAAPSSRSPSRSPRNGDPYAADDRYQLYSSTPRNNNSSLGIVNPNEIMDDGDDGLDYSKHSQRNSTLSASNSDRTPKVAAGTAAATAAGGAAGGVLAHEAQNAGNGGGRAVEYDLATGQEKSPDWVDKTNSKRRMWKWIIILAIFLVIAGAIVGGVVGGLVGGSKHGGKSGKGGSGSGGSSGGGGGNSDKGGDLSLNSPDIQSLLNNKNLHKVFPGMDYTPQNTQYPACLTDPPSQNDITKDVAVLSQLTNKIRLYGTDCNQTQMVLHAIDRLKMTDTIKVWLGVWQDNNGTTNARQLEQMWDILDNYGSDPFEGIIVANEVLFRQQFTVASLGSLLSSVRTNLTAKSISLPVATSDLGDDWTSALASSSDYIMANVHPFFSGTPADEAASWTWSFWEGHDGQFWKTDKEKNIISETGWPTGGGTDCGSATSCTNGAVAGIDELNQFMGDWVCQALANGTNYFWFEAFDEPWKVQFNTPGKSWEDKWGLMDVNRKLKPGVKIPDCGGKTIS